jgi:hypothetical protein
MLQGQARRPVVITDDMLHIMLRRRANSESVEVIRPDLITPTGSARSTGHLKHSLAR